MLAPGVIGKEQRHCIMCSTANVVTNFRCGRISCRNTLAWIQKLLSQGRNWGWGCVGQGWVCWV